MTQQSYANSKVHDLRVGQTFVEFTDALDHPYDDKEGKLKIITHIEKRQNGDVVTFRNYCREKCLRDEIETRRVGDLDYEKFDLNELKTNGRSDNGFYWSLGHDYTHDPDISLFRSPNDFKVGTQLIYFGRGHDGKGKLTSRARTPNYELVTIANINIMRNKEVFVAFWNPTFGTLDFLSINFAADHEMLQRSYKHIRKLFKYNPTDSVLNGDSIIRVGDEIFYRPIYDEDRESSFIVNEVTNSGFAIAYYDPGTIFSRVKIIFLDIWMR